MAAPVLTLSMRGQSFTFRSKNPNDPIVYSGTIDKFVGPDDAAKYDNIVAYNKAVCLVDSTVPTDVDDIGTFFIFKLNNSSGSQIYYPFCADWVAEGSWTPLDIVATVLVEVLDTNTDHSLIISALSSAGYSNATIKSISSSS